MTQAELLGHVVRFGRLDDLGRYIPYAAGCARDALRQHRPRLARVGRQRQPARPLDGLVPPAGLPVVHRGGHVGKGILDGTTLTCELMELR